MVRPSCAALPVAALLACGALALPAQAATTAEASMEGEVRLLVEIPAGLTFEYRNQLGTGAAFTIDEDAGGPPSEVGSGSVDWDADALAVAVPPPPMDDEFHLTLEMEASSGPTEGSSFLDVTVSTLFTLVNVGESDETATFTVSHDVTTFSSVTDPVWNWARSSGFWALQINTFNNTLGGGQVLEELSPVVGILESNAQSEGTADPFSLTLEPDTSASVFFYLAGTVETETFAATPIPLPAGLPLLLAALGGLAVLRRRQRGA